MRENIFNKLLIACCLLAMVSCKAHKKLITANAPVVIHTDNKEAKLDLIRAQQVNFNTFSGKAKANLAFGNINNDCTFNIRISKDKKIWVSITALLGIEVGRALITPDSVLIINRLQGVYVKKPFSFIYAYANRQVNFTMLQALMVGNAVPQLINGDANYQATASGITLSGTLHDLIYKLMLGSDMKVVQTTMSDQSAGQSLQVNDSFTQSGNLKVPSQIDIVSVIKDKKIQVNLRYVKVDYNQPLDFPFSIPDKYTPAN